MTDRERLCFGQSSLMQDNSGKYDLDLFWGLCTSRYDNEQSELWS